MKFSQWNSKFYEIEDATWISTQDLVRQSRTFGRDLKDKQEFSILILRRRRSPRRELRRTPCENWTRTVAAKQNVIGINFLVVVAFFKLMYRDYVIGTMWWRSYSSNTEYMQFKIKNLNYIKLNKIKLYLELNYKKIN